MYESREMYLETILLLRKRKGQGRGKNLAGYSETRTGRQDSNTRNSLRAL